jgi:hypothetical protein
MAVDAAPAAAGAEPSNAHFIKRVRHAYVPVVRSPGCYSLRAPYDMVISPHTKAMVSTEVLVQLHSYCLGIISPCHDWRFGEHLDIVTEVLATRRFTCLRVVVWNHTSRPLRIPRGRTEGMLSLVGRYEQGPWPCTL